MTDCGQEAAPAWPDLWGRDADGAYFIACHCEGCGGYALGRREFCPHCHAAGALREARVGRSGRLYSATVIHQGPSGFAAPYRVGYVDIEGGIRVFAHVENASAGPRIGDTVVLRIEPRMRDRDGQPRTVPLYAAKNAGSGS